MLFLDMVKCLFSRAFAGCLFSGSRLLEPTSDFGVAMGNAPDHVKKVADATVASCDEDGFADTTIPPDSASKRYRWL